MFHGINGTKNPMTVNRIAKKGVTMRSCFTLVAIVATLTISLGSPAHAQNWGALAGDFARAGKAASLFRIAAQCPKGVCPNPELAAKGNALKADAKDHCKTAYGPLDSTKVGPCQTAVAAIPSFTSSGGGSTPPVVHHGGGGGWCAHLQKPKTKDIPETDCKCPDGTDDIQLPNQPNKKKTGCKAKWIKDKECFVVKDGEQCPCPDSTPLLNKEKWECEKCPSDKPVFAELEDGSKGCASCFDVDDTKPFWDRCDGKCKACPDLTPFWDGKDCVQCEEKTPLWNAKSGKCEACPAATLNWVPPRDGQCIACAEDTQWNPISKRCLLTKTHRCIDSGVMVTDEKKCPPWGVVSQKWGKKQQCSEPTIEVQTHDPTAPSRCVCKYGGECGTWSGDGWPWWVWFLIGLSIGIFATLGFQAGRRKWRENRFPH